MKIPFKKQLIIFLEKNIGYHKKNILNPTDGNLLISELLRLNSPVAIGKIGSVENWAIRYFLQHRSSSINVVWSHELYRDIYEKAGVFPQQDNIFNSFILEFLESIKQLDVLAVWYNRGESNIVKSHAYQAKLTSLLAIEPYYHQEPWSQNLANKKILVIHPFTESIKQQYKHRDKLWKYQTCLPNFELVTIKSPLSHALVRSGFDSWLDALQSLKEQMSQKEFDVALVGAGAYSLPLVAHAKKIGKLGIHLGGATQILFGIKGKRWDNHQIGLNFYNDYWRRPLPEETPGNIDVLERIDQGAYW
ncbi:MAG: hypothetical protein RH949_13940 [Coleofasciculus sp. A1-SPW-01]|uniref:hypothetical protein n=1 Tax=Coleofasciculus sp. A1-SPW-01 TaxID=3070819 RepID=UPI003301FCB2